ncbi:hypothetical protein HNY73_009942 [Argiope bruennichi]|uniref:Uncharacterized protein n=1 Tax=Argiope bruennichi TaxID=94029 RepID=A0A8T0F6V7_ARGBR|nr:hypothetical protein HNY73_009942 [Argiope bruennichi]
MHMDASKERFDGPSSLRRDPKLLGTPLILMRCSISTPPPTWEHQQRKGSCRLWASQTTYLLRGSVPEERYNNLVSLNFSVNSMLRARLSHVFTSFSTFYYLQRMQTLTLEQLIRVPYRKYTTADDNERAPLLPHRLRRSHGPNENAKGPTGSHLCPPKRGAMARPTNGFR